MDKKITYIDEVEITKKTVLLRADFDVSLNKNLTIANDARIQHNLPTIKYLLDKGNKLICIAKLDRPKKRDPSLSLKVIVERLHSYLPDYKITLVDDFLTADPAIFRNQLDKEIIVLENIRFYPEEKRNDSDFAKKLAALGDVYVNDAFAMTHRIEASVVGITNFLPSYGGILLKKEIGIITQTLKNPKKPLVAIIGGAKISTKINLIGKLTEIADYVLVGGGLANTFFSAQEIDIGKSICDYESVEAAKRLLFLAAQKNTSIILPTDVIESNDLDSIHGERLRNINNISRDYYIADIGPETEARFGAVIAQAKTIIWNGPMGYIENPLFMRGTDFIYYSITQNQNAVSLVGGGDTLSAISKKEFLDKITHISTGGGAMLEFIEKGTLPGIEALKR